MKSTDAGSICKCFSAAGGILRPTPDASDFAIFFEKAGGSDHEPFREQTHQDGQKLVCESGDHEALTSHKSAISGSGRGGGFHRKRILPDIFRVRPYLELSLCGAGAKSGDRDTGPSKFIRKRFGEGKHIRFGSKVAGHEGAGLESGRGRYVKDLAMAVPEHLREQEAR